VTLTQSTTLRPETRWNHELLEAAGEAKFRSIVAEVKAMAQDIGNCELFSPLFLWHPMLMAAMLELSCFTCMTCIVTVTDIF
jgi:hypothetical protein